MKIDYEIQKDDIGKEIKYVLKNKLYISSIMLKNVRENKGIFVNSKNVYTNHIIKENDIITIDFNNIPIKNKFEDKFKLVDAPLDILYEDEYMLVVNKDTNMPVHPSSNNYENTLANIVANYLKKQNIYGIHIVTRLDHNTTGICIFAKYPYIQELFIRKKNEINLQKWYTAIVNGLVEKDHDIIEANIARKQNTIILREVNKDGDFAKTEYFVKKRNKEKNYTVLDILLHTGRTHQIRVHMSYIGHTLLGDELYANEYNVKNIYEYINRQALHCSKIIFNHPITNEHINIECKLPEDIEKILTKNKKSNII